MQKVFALLLAELRKLGATIIFANFSKIIIDTGRFDLQAAKAYCDSLLKTVQTRLFFFSRREFIFHKTYVVCILFFLIIFPFI